MKQIGIVNKRQISKSTKQYILKHFREDKITKVNLVTEQQDHKIMKA